MLRDKCIVHEMHRLMFQRYNRKDIADAAVSRWTVGRLLAKKIEWLLLAAMLFLAVSLVLWWLVSADAGRAAIVIAMCAIAAAALLKFEQRRNVAYQLPTPEEYIIAYTIGKDFDERFDMSTGFWRTGCIDSHNCMHWQGLNRGRKLSECRNPEHCTLCYNKVNEIPYFMPEYYA